MKYNLMAQVRDCSEEPFRLAEINSPDEPIQISYNELLINDVLFTFFHEHRVWAEK